MRSFLENAFMISYAVVVVLSIIKYPKYFDTPLRYLPIIFFYTLLTEFLGGIILFNDNWRFFGNDLLEYYNLVIYNIYAIVFFLFFFYIYYTYLGSTLFRKFVVIGALLFIAVSLVNPFFQSFLFTSQTWAYVTGTLVLLVSIGLYFWELRHVESAPDWRHNLLFWISLSLFIFYAAYLPIEIYRYQNLYQGGHEPSYVRSIVHALILLLNILISVGFLLMKNQPQPIKR